MNENNTGLDQTPEPSAHSIVDFTFDDLTALLGRTVRVTAVLGVLVSLVLWLWMGWQTAALFAVGSLLSVGSIYEWGRLIRVVSARMDGHKAGQGTGLGSRFGAGTVVGLFLLRLILFAVVIYVSLKCFQGSPIALLCGLGLALAGLVWEAMRVLRG